MVESPRCHGNNQLEVQPEDMEDSCQNSQGKKKSSGLATYKKHCLPKAFASFP